MMISNGTLKKTKGISHAVALRMIEKAASSFNGTREEIEKIAKQLRNKGEADISNLDPPSLRRDLCNRFPACSNESGYQSHCCRARIFAWDGDLEMHMAEHNELHEEVEEEVQHLKHKLLAAKKIRRANVDFHTELAAAVKEARASRVPTAAAASNKKATGKRAESDGGDDDDESNRVKELPPPVSAKRVRRILVEKK